MGILEKLSANRTPILLAEIGAYLHLIGRFSKEFIFAHAQDATNQEKQFDYQKVCNDTTFWEGTNLNDLLKDEFWENLINNFQNLSNLGELLSNKIKNFCEFIKKHTWGDNPRGICKILADAHGIVSGIDKALAGRGESGKQKKDYTFRATAFGFEQKIELLERPDLKKELFEKIKSILTKIKTNEEVCFSDYQEFLSTIKEYYPKTIGETRRPINEISLYDYAHTIASLLKSNLAKIIIDGWYEPKGQSRWRIIRVNVDVIGLLSKGIKIGDILGYKNEIEETFKKIKKIIEFDYPLGNEIYRDSTGIYFSCPNFTNINQFEQEIKEKLKEIDALDFSLQVSISDDSRSMTILASERDKALKEIVYVHTGNVEYLEQEFKESEENGGIEICPVCRIRLRHKDKDRCERCSERYYRRSRDWINNPQETIWLDEVADKNDRVALIVGQFDLRKWLNGEFVGTFVSQTFEEWKNDLSEEVKNFLQKNRRVRTLSQLEAYLLDLLNNKIKLEENDLRILKSFIYLPKVSAFDINKHFWKPIAERDATGVAPSLADNAQKAKHLIKLLFRKHPSLARIYRIWNTTQEFINQTIFEEILKNYSWKSNPRRMRIKFKLEPNPRIPEGSTCDTDLGFSPVCVDKENGIFISTINLEILERFGKNAEEIAKKINGMSIKIKTEEEKNWKEAKITEAQLAEEKYQNYYPFIKIYDFPDQFMVLVPAFDALDIAEKIFEEYEVQFSKVRDRLPLHLGIIAFHRRTPLYVAMDAGKRFLDSVMKKTTTKEATIESISDYSDDKFGKFTKKLELKVISDCSSVPLTWCISYSTGDPEQEDNWHPYIRIKCKNPNRDPYSFDYTGEGNYVVHVKKLKKCDTIYIEPSYFKIAFLGSSSDRFKIDENLRPLDDIKRMIKLWDDIKDIVSRKKIGISRLYAYWQEVEKRRNYDNSTWEEFIKASITNILEVSPQEEDLFNEILQATKDGLLSLCLFWNLQVRKIKPGKGG